MPGAPLVKIPGAAAAASADGPFSFSSVSGTNTITATSSGPALAAGQTFILIPANTNSGAVTLNGAAVKKADGTTALAAGDLVAGKSQFLLWDGTVYRLVTGIPLGASDILIPLHTGSSPITLAEYFARGGGQGQVAGWSNIPISLLSGGATGYSDSFDPRLFSSLNVLYSADQLTAVAGSNGVRLQLSLDGGTSWDWYTAATAITAAGGIVPVGSTGLIFQPPLMRLAVVNGATPQTASDITLTYLRQAASFTRTEVALSPTLLTSGGVYTTPSYQIGGRLLNIIVVADQNSASTGVMLQQSYDNVTWWSLFSGAQTLTAGTAVFISMTVQIFPYFRLRYTNGSSTQGRFRIYIAYA